MPRPRDPVQLTLLALALAVLLVECWKLQPHLDDAWISYRYAKNLLAGHGLVYNPGEYVEGYTNLLWTLLVALGMAAGATAKQAGHVLGVLGGAATLVAATLYASSGRSDPVEEPPGGDPAPAGVAWLTGLVPWLLLASHGLPRWSTSGMETLFFSAGTTAALAAGARGRVGLATLCSGVATLTRPEGVLVAAIVLAPFAWSALRAAPGAPGRSRAMLCLAGYAGLLLLLTSFRLAYYGAPLPNTFYAKAGSGSLAFGWLYLKGFLASGPVFLLPAAALAAVWEPRWRPGAAVVLAYAGYVVWVGGDAFGHRFVLPVLPALAALAVVGVQQAWRRNRTLCVLLATTLPAAAGAFLLEGFPPSLFLLLVAAAGLGLLALRLHRALPIAAGAVAVVLLLSLWPARDRGSQLTDLLRRLATPARNLHLAEVRDKDGRLEILGRRAARMLRKRDEGVRLVATGAIGVFGYHSDFAVLDIFGLTDATIARSRARREEGQGGLPGHSRSNADYVLERAPDYVIVGRGRAGRWLPAIRDLLEHPEFARRYEFDEKLRGYRSRALGPPAGPRRGG